MDLTQISSMSGAVLILAAYFALRLGRIGERSLAYLVLNLVGGLCLFYSAVVTRQAGFILLEGSWVGISLYGIKTRAGKK